MNYDQNIAWSCSVCTLTQIIVHKTVQMFRKRLRRVDGGGRPGLVILSGLVDRARSPRHNQASRSLASLARHILRTTSLLRCLNSVISLVVLLLMLLLKIFCCHQDQEKEKLMDQAIC